MGLPPSGWNPRHVHYWPPKYILWRCDCGDHEAVTDGLANVLGGDAHTRWRCREAQGVYRPIASSTKCKQCKVEGFALLCVLQHINERFLLLGHQHNLVTTVVRVSPQSLPNMAAQAAAHIAATRAIRTHPIAFFREVCRCLPWVVQNYKLDELLTVNHLRKNVAAAFRQHANVSTPEVIDLMVFKGREELELVLQQHKQRHHLIEKYVAPFERKIKAVKPVGTPFLEAFYSSNQ